ncbi:MAG: hypothetical protein CM15mP120_19150 [Pseudomonadota bacterium]|nr:MAG: hypothetical protein CM15mP120_19150 [Pseudomonadota bacterium]
MDVTQSNVRYLLVSAMALEYVCKVKIMTATANHFGNLKFLKPETQSSLFRNDLVRMVRDHRGNLLRAMALRPNHTS